MSYKHWYKKSGKTLTNWTPKYFFNYTLPQPSRAYPEKSRLLQYFKKINVIYFISRLKKKSYIIMSADKEIALEKIQYPFKIKKKKVS